MRAIVITSLALMSAAGVSAQQWQIMRFAGTESFEFSLTQTTDGVREEGRLALSLSGGGAQAMASIDANLGDVSCSATVPMSNAQAAAPMIMMQCAAIAPVALAMFNPMFITFFSQPWVEGTRMQMSQGNDAMSFSITEGCSFGGQSGLLAQVQSNEMNLEVCADPEIPLPLMVHFDNQSDNQVIRAELTSFSR